MEDKIKVKANSSKLRQEKMLKSFNLSPVVIVRGKKSFETKLQAETAIENAR